MCRRVRVYLYTYILPAYSTCNLDHCQCHSPRVSHPHTLKKKKKSFPPEDWLRTGCSRAKLEQSISLSPTKSPPAQWEDVCFPLRWASESISAVFFFSLIGRAPRRKGRIEPNEKKARNSDIGQETATLTGRLRVTVVFRCMKTSTLCGALPMT